MVATEQDVPNMECANPDCRVAIDGRCVEGFADKASCPQFGKAVTEQELAQPSVIVQTRTCVALAPAMTLTVADAEQVLVDRLARLIAIVGPHDAGKTSLIAGLYDLFQEGPINDVAFARSLTLHSFEQACHDSRAASRRDQPHMDRTPLGEVRFYHLDLVDKHSATSAAVLLGDRAGEEYFETRNDPDAASAFPELKRADTITVLADGAKLLHTGLRHNVRSDVRQTLQAFVDAGVVKPWQRLAVVLTKLDEVRSNTETGPRAQADFDGIVQAVQTTFASHFAKIEAFRVAASPKSEAATRGEGLADLLKYWIAPALRYEPGEVPRTVVSPSRAFGRLQPVAKEVKSNG
jgi:hypothetical protein